MEISLSSALRFFVILVRVSGIVMLLPVFGARGVPVRVKVGLSIFLSLLLFSTVPSIPLAIEGRGVLAFVLLGLRELLVGIVLGIVSVLIFEGVQLAGQVIGFQMGFGIVNVLDPQANLQVSIIGQFQYLLAIMIFLAIDGHLFLLRALASSFDLIPLGGMHFSPGLFDRVTRLTAQIFVIAVKLGAPAFATLLFTDVALGILARTVPQMNIFIVGFPLKIGVGLMAVMLSLPLLPYMFGKLWGHFERQIMILLRMMGE